MRMCLTVRMECSVCGQVHGASDIDAALFGAVAYKVCPCCEQVVDDHTNPEYRQRAEEYSR